MDQLLDLFCTTQIVPLIYGNLHRHSHVSSSFDLCPHAIESVITQAPVHRIKQRDYSAYFKKLSMYPAA